MENKNKVNITYKQTVTYNVNVEVTDEQLRLLMDESCFNEREVGINSEIFYEVTGSATPDSITDAEMEIDVIAVTKS